jgi:hypothetical protein
MLAVILNIYVYSSLYIFLFILKYLPLYIDIPTEENIQVYRKDFGDDYFSFWCNGCK